MAQTARQIHIIAQRRRPVAYWVLSGGFVVASVGLALIDQRFGVVMMMLAMFIGGVFRRWAADGQ